MVALVLASWLGKAFIFNSEGPWGSQSSSQNFQEVSISVCSVGRPHVRPGPDECVLIFVSENMLRVTGEREIGKDSSWSPVLGMRWKPRRGSISVCLSNGSYHSLSGWRGRQRQGRLVQPRSFHKHVLVALSTAESQAEAKLHTGCAIS